LSQRRFERLASYFGWFILDECPPFEMVDRPEAELRFLWDRRRRHGRSFSAWAAGSL
jgi:hypothetical protein